MNGKRRDSDGQDDQKRKDRGTRDSEFEKRKPQDVTDWDKPPRPSKDKEQERE